MKHIEFIKEHLGERCTDATIEWLRDIGYFTCPAAKSHHGNHEGGLYNHSMMVASELERLTKGLNLEWERPESPWVVGLLHDICKTDDYDYEFGEDTYIDYKPNHMGHGSKSVLLIAGHFPLTEEEAMCITYHMGAFTDKEEWKYYSNAVKEYPNVLYTHTADMIASQIKGV